MKIIIIISIAAALVAITVAVIEHIRTRRLTDRIGDMLDSAIKGDFTESTYDESVESLLESKLGEYLSSSSLSAKKIERLSYRIYHIRPRPP